MGNSQSPSANPRLAYASRAFTPKELEDLKTLFESLAAQSQSNGKYISASVFQAYFRLNGPLGKRMFDLITQKRKDEKLTYEDIVIAKATYEKGARSEIEEFIYQLLDVNDDGIVGRSDLESVLNTMFENIFNENNSDAESQSWKDTMNIFLDATIFSQSGGGSPEKGMSIEDFRSWCALIPSARKFLGSLLLSPDSGRPGSQVPRLLYPETINQKLLILRREHAWHIGGALPHEELEDWKLLYHSSLHGLSFSTFLGNISNDMGPTVLILKDREGCIYGGYASQPWERHGDFYGDMKSFLFQLYPKASIFKPSGANHNIQWCAVNFSSDDIPNGVGFGGQVNHLGLFLSANFDQGHTFSCTTFGSPSLSKTSRIQPEVIECWGVIPVDQKEKADALKGTVLDRFKEDRNMLKMVGMANSSE